MLLDRPEARLGIALGIGLVVGAERERRKGEGPHRAPAGIRTFALVALLGGVVALVDNAALVAVVGAFVGAIAIGAYWLGDRTDPGFTTEVALLLTYCLGALAERRPAAALAAGLSTATILAARAPLHSAVRSVLSEEELRDGLIFAVAALVILPLLPNRAVDPLGVLNPFTLWRLVVLLMGMSAAGYVAQRIVGARYGLALTGFASGFVSSAATIAAMGARARSDEALLRPAVAGAAASTVATFVQLAILVGAASPSLLRTLAWPLAAGGATALAYAAVQTWRARRVDLEPTRGRAFKVSTALLFAVLVTVIAFASTAARRWLGAAGAVVTAALAGFADVHAAAGGIASIADQIGRSSAVLAVLVAITANTVTKAVLASTTGPRAYAVRVVAGLALVLAAVWIAALAGCAILEHPAQRAP